MALLTLFSGIKTLFSGAKTVFSGAKTVFLKIFHFITGKFTNRSSKYEVLEHNKIHCLDARSGLKLLPDKSINCIVTSPPYFGLRDYNVAGQIGLESTIDKYIKSLLLVFNECYRVLKDDGTLWLNIGDSYSTGGRGFQWGISTFKKDMGWRSAPAGYKRKELLGIPWLVAFALQRSGWYLRQDIIWNKPNPMPESVGDRCTKAHEYIFLLSKSPKYYFDAKAIATPYRDKTFTTFGIPFKPGHGDGSGLIFAENYHNTCKVRKPKVWKTPDGWDTGIGTHGSYHKDGREQGQTGYIPKRNPRPDIDVKGGNQGTGGIPIKGYDHRHGYENITGHSGYYTINGDLIGDGLANKRSVWTVATQSFKEAHFATFPQELIVDCIKAGCCPGGILSLTLSWEQGLQRWCPGSWTGISSDSRSTKSISTSPRRELMMNWGCFNNISELKYEKY